MRSRRGVLRSLATAVALYGLDGCGRRAPATNVAELRNRAGLGDLRIAYIPYDELTRDEGSGRAPSGFLPDICKMFLQAANISTASIQWRSVAWETFGGLVAADTVDFSIAGTFITPARRQVVDFTHPLFSLGNGALAKQGVGGLGAISSVSDLDRKGLRIAVVVGEQSADYVRTNFDKASILLLDGPDLSAAPRSVEQGHADVAMSDQFILGRFARAHPSFVDLLEHRPFAVLPIAWAFPKNSGTLVSEVDDILGNILAQKAYADLMARYPMVPFVTAAG